MVKCSCMLLGIKRLLQILVFCLFACFFCAFYFESCVVWMEAEVAGCSIGYLWSRKVLSKCFRYSPSCARQTPDAACSPVCQLLARDSSLIFGPPEQTSAAGPVPLPLPPSYSFRDASGEWSPSHHCQRCPPK